MLVRYEVVFPPIPCVGPALAETFWRAPGACREPRTAHSPGRTCSRWICRWLKGDNKHKQRHVCVICKWRPPSKLWVERSRTRVCGLPRLTFRCISWSSIVLLFYLIIFLFGFPNLLKKQWNRPICCCSDVVCHVDSIPGRNLYCNKSSALETRRLDKRARDSNMFVQLWFEPTVC